MGEPSRHGRLLTVAVAGLIGAGGLVVPATAAQAVPAAAQAVPAATVVTRAAVVNCPQGVHQRAVEQYLAKLGGFGRITVDGRQSAADCAAITKFQKRYDIRPAKGRAGPTTLDVAKRLATTNTSRCKPGKATVICVNLTLQTVWVMRGGKVVVKPTVTRTGMKGFRTPAGSYRIDRRNKKEWSNPYEVWLPYWQHFTRGMGFHQTTTYIHNKRIGSHGCVNLLPADARALWRIGKIGMKVKTFGRRAGT